MKKLPSKVAHNWLGLAVFNPANLCFLHLRQFYSLKFLIFEVVKFCRIKSSLEFLWRSTLLPICTQIFKKEARRIFVFWTFIFFLNYNLSRPKYLYCALKIETAHHRTFKKVTFYGCLLLWSGDLLFFGQLLCRSKKILCLFCFCKLTYPCCSH